MPINDLKLSAMDVSSPRAARRIAARRPLEGRPTMNGTSRRRLFIRASAAREKRDDVLVARLTRENEQRAKIGK